MRSLGVPIIMFGETAPQSPSFVRRLLAAADAALASETPSVTSIPRFLQPPADQPVEAVEDQITIRADAESARILAALAPLSLDDPSVG